MRHRIDLYPGLSSGLSQFRGGSEQGRCSGQLVGHSVGKLGDVSKLGVEWVRNFTENWRKNIAHSHGDIG